MNIPKIEDVWLKRWKFNPATDELVIAWSPDAQRWTVCVGDKNIDWVEVTQAVTPINWAAESRLILGGKAPGNWFNTTEIEDHGPCFELIFSGAGRKLSLCVELNKDLQVEWSVFDWSGADWKLLRKGIDPDNSFLRSMLVCEELLHRVHQ